MQKSNIRRKSLAIKGFKKALKKQVWLKILLAGPSGSGKTYSALRVAQGIAKKEGSRVAAIDTENGRIRYYANEFDFDDMQLEQPYTPESYIEAIDAAVDAGYKVLIIDSITHEWNYCLETVDKMPGTNSFTKWKSVTPRHNLFVEKIIQSPIHIVATVRGKDVYVLEQDSKGRQIPKKVGLGYSQRDGLEFEYTVTFNVDPTHISVANKDNTHIFENKFEKLTEKDGEELWNWANDGEKEIEPPTLAPKEYKEADPVSVVEAPLDELAAAVKVIADKCSKLIDAGTDKEIIASVIKEIAGTANYNKIDNIDTANKLLEKLGELN